MKTSEGFSLEEYQIQRKYREEKRKEYLRKFQVLRHKMNLPSHFPHPHQNTNLHQSSNQYLPSDPQNQQLKVQKPQQPSSAPRNTEQENLQKQNVELKNQLVELEQKQRKSLESFKARIGQVKSQYVEKIKQINKVAVSQQQNGSTKLQQLSQQIKSAEEKNKQIGQLNTKIQQEIEDSQSIMNKYGTEIKNQYAVKLQEFQKIFLTSSEKIEAMEKQFEDDEFIQNTLNNQELIDSIRQNSEKANEDIDNILKDYKQLLSGKSQILTQLMTNNEMKQREIKKMNELQGKLKDVFEKLNEEKKVYIAENTKMAEELTEVKKLLMGSMPEGAS